MASTVLWTTFSAPKTLFNVGSDAVCMLCDNILCFTDLKSAAISYYQAESPETGLSIRAATGHHKFSLVAFCDLVLRPAVHIIEYPSFNKYAVFKTEKIITFVDLRFNDYDLLLALSGFPNYTFCIWNFRTGQQLLQHDTLKESLAQSILCSYHHTPQIVQFSEWNREILVWELCYTATAVDLHEVSKIQLSKDFTYSNISIMCYTEDNSLYVVDNFANVFLLEVAHFYLRPVWSTGEAQDVCATLKRFCLESHKQGLLVYSPEIVYYLRRKQSKWQCEWKLLADQLPQGLCKCLSNGNGELYASAAVGNLYQIKTSTEKIEVVPVNAHRNENSIDVVLLKGIKHECLIQLTTTSFINALAIAPLVQYSRVQIPEATCVAAHTVAPYILVGTATGQICCLDYTNIREPSTKASTQNEKHVSIQSLLFSGRMAVYRTIYNEFRLLVADIPGNIFYEVATFERFTEEVGIREYFLAQSLIFIFFNRNSPILMPHANLMCCYQFHIPAKGNYDRLEYNLTRTYRDVAILSTTSKNVVEFLAVRLETCIMDCLNFHSDTNELVIVYSIQTNHLSYIHGIKGSMNLLTWGLDGTFIHYRSHRKSSKAFGVSQILQIKYRPRVVKKVFECFMAKYLVYIYSRGGIKVKRVASTGAVTIENSFINETPVIIQPDSITVHDIDPRKSTLVIEHSPEELQARDNILQKVRSLRQRVSNLIDYDMSVTGKSQGVFKKFCLNHKWLNKVTEEARKLCHAERKSLEAAILDQTRIKDWICVFVTGTNMGITYQLRAIFSHFLVANFGLRKTDHLKELFDLYRFYEMDSGADEDAFEENEPSGLPEVGEEKNLETKESAQYFRVRGLTYDHVMCDEFAMQDVNIVTGNQMVNQDAKVRVLLIDRLKNDFNKLFEEIKQTKHELMEAIWNTNSHLNKIYHNINCMLKLLDRAEFEPPQLTIPEWHKDEFVQSIMEVDDSEIKAVNRHKKKDEIELEKRGRLLLWSVEFWQRALNDMMDGVLEKLWEEEIKKAIPKPEFLNKKDAAEYTLEDQKLLREYEEKCRLLTEDRQKYLQMLNDDETKTNLLKTSYILKLNESVTQLMITKLKYDFAINHVRLRNFNTKIMYFKKLQWLERINMLRTDIDLLAEYIEKYGKLHEFWSKSVDDFRQKVDSLTLKQKAIERQYRGQFLNSIPQHLGPEMNKTFKKRPKISPKLLNSTLICKELAMRINSKSKPKFPFPLPKDVFEYLEGLNALDDLTNIPVSLDSKNWDQFVKLRRQKVEMELKVRAVNLQLGDFVADMNLYGKELGNLKNGKIDAAQKLQEAQTEYLNSIQDQTLEIRLTMGQVEFNIMGSLENLENCVLIHKDDINDINALILNAGQRKIKAMQKVAFFRRQVIYREWEHKVVSANIEYLNNMLQVISKCKVSVEFLNILRNWDKIKMKKQEENTEGLLAKVTEEKLMGYRKELTRLSNKILQTRQQIDEMKQSSKRIDRQIEQLKTSVAFAQTNRDHLLEEKRKREQNEKMEKIKRHSSLIEAVRRDYVHIMELKTILELQRLRTYPTLGPNPRHCLN